VKDVGEEAMSIDDTTKKVIEIIAEQAMLRPEEVQLESSPEDLGLDSLALVEIVFAIEETFDISIPFNANDTGGSDFDISSVGKIAEAVESLRASKG
jgi:acyl carrier protein